MLRELASRKKAAFMQSLVGTTVQAITLQSGGRDFTEALTENYLKTRIFGRHAPNRWRAVNIAGIDGEMLVGSPYSDPSESRGLTGKAPYSHILC